MFIGAITAQVRQFLGNVAPVFAGRTVVIGCSGNFSMETVLSATTHPAAIHSNDVSLYSCLVGHWLTGQPFPCTVRDAAYDWLAPYLLVPEQAVAAVMVLLDMLAFHPQANPHQVRLWNNYRGSFSVLVAQTLVKVRKVQIRLASFYAGDVLEHFQRFAEDSNAIFACFAPTYAGGYERLYKRLHAVLAWQEPSYRLLDEHRRATLLAWMQQRHYLWYDDRLLPDTTPIMAQRRGRMRTVYLYSNVVTRRVVLQDPLAQALPSYPLGSTALLLRPATIIALHRITTVQLAAYKDAFLSKAIAYGAGTWAFLVQADGLGIGFLEFAPGKFQRADIYLQADFVPPHLPYHRLSKLMAMLACAGETRTMLERLIQLRIRRLSTTAYTDKPVSMKYRGVFSLLKRGVTPDGQPFLNYGAPFSSLTWQETYTQWLMKHGLQRSSSN